MAPAAHSDRGVEDVLEAAGAALQGGHSAAVQVDQQVRDQKVKSKTNTKKDDQNPDRSSFIPRISDDMLTILIIHSASADASAAKYSEMSATLGVLSLVVPLKMSVGE